MDQVLTIAGYDPSSGAGMTADLAVFAAHGLFGTSCITALTVQTTMGVVSTHPVSGAVVRQTLETLEADLPPAGIKIGMLATAECVTEVAGYLERLAAHGRRPVVVLDPVLRSSSGRDLLDPSAWDILGERLIPLVDWMTPNGDELMLLAGCEPSSPRHPADIVREAIALQARFARLNVLVTGGDSEPPDDLVLCARGSEAARETWLAGERVTTTATHGTGCALSSALMCRLVLGDAPLAAARGAKDYVTEALRRAVPIGHGHGPMNHLWPLRAG